MTKRWFMASARLYPAEAQNIRFFRLLIAATVGKFSFKLYWFSLVQNFLFLIFFWKNTQCRKKFARSILCSFGFYTATYFFCEYSEDASKRLSCYCTEALNWCRNISIPFHKVSGSFYIWNVSLILNYYQFDLFLH